jgi:hypothetical protein
MKALKALKTDVLVGQRIDKFSNMGVVVEEE